MAQPDSGNPEVRNSCFESDCVCDRAELESQGWAGLKVDDPEQMHRIAVSLGPVMANRRTGVAFTDLAPYESNSAPTGSMSSLVGTSEQPMHTDGAHLHEPPRYIAFLCLNPGEVPCPTQIWQIDVLRLQQNWPLLLSDPNWIFDDCFNPPFYSPILQRHKDSLKIRFDPCCMRPATHSRLRVLDALKELKHHAHAFYVDWQQGTAIIIDNWRCLHGRGAGSMNSPSRHLRRWCIGG
jgi:hypothetical protein